MHDERTDDTTERVLRVARETLTGRPDAIDLSTPIAGGLARDSLEQLTLFLALEDEFNDTIPPEEAEPLKTLNDVVEFIDARLAAQG